MNKGLIALGILVGIRVTVAILNRNEKRIANWIKSKMKKDNLDRQQLSAVMMGQGKLVRDYNILLREIFKNEEFPKNKSTDEILGEAIERINHMTNSECINTAEVIKNRYGRETNINVYDIPPDEELDVIHYMLDSIEDGYLDIRDRYEHPELFIVQQCLVRRMVELENQKKKGDDSDDSE